MTVPVAFETRAFKQAWLGWAGRYFAGGRLSWRQMKFVYWVCCAINVATGHKVRGELPLVMFVCPCQNEEKILDPVHTPQADVKASLTIPNHSQSGGVCHESCL